MNKEKIFHCFDFPAERGVQPHFEVNGNSQFLADGCPGVLHYDENRVALNCGKIVVEIEGEALMLNYLSEKEAEVRGTLHSVKFV